MSSVKILHCADLHIGATTSFLGERAESRRFETLITFERIINTAKKNGVNILLIAGDLFNSNNIENVFFERVFECFEQIPEIKIVFAAGNHDSLNADSPFKKYTLPENLYVLNTYDDCIEFSELGVRVYGKSFKEVYMHGSEQFKIKPNDKFINIMCIHGELKSDLNSNYNAITPDFIKSSGMDYIALGHVHKRTDIAKIGNTYFSYCGCAEGKGFDELGEKGVYLGTVSKHDCAMQFLPCAKRMHLLESIDISGVENSAKCAERVLSHIAEKYPEGYTENLYKIVLCGETHEGVSISLDEITSRLNEQLYFAKLRDNTTLAVDLEALSKENSLKGIFVSKMLSLIDSAADDEKVAVTNALNIGLKAFLGEVSFDED